MEMDADTTLVRRRYAVPAFLTDPPHTSFVHPATGLSYALNETGRSILESLREEESVGAIAQRIGATFDVPGAQAHAGVESFLRQMAELGLVEIRTTSDPQSAVRGRYLELLRRALVNLIYPEHELQIEWLESGAAPADRHARDRALRDIRYRDTSDFAGLIAAKQNGSVWRGKPWRFSHTMVGMRRLEHLQWCAERVFEDHVPGDFLEAGVCQGGASILLRALQVVHGEPHRRTWLADSFEGLPVPSHEADTNYDFSETKQPWLACSRAAVEDNFRTYDLLSDEVVFLPGWFRDTLARAPVSTLAILRLDADLYESTRDILLTLYDRVSPGGFIVVDDYDAFAPCRQAVQEFRSERGITAPIRHIDRMAVYWRRAG
jgi:O-methyltransferase